LLISEMFMNFYVVPACLRIAHDTLPGFLLAMLDYPPALRPKALLARLRRTPEVESVERSDFES
jgi:hypothetical protein